MFTKPKKNEITNKIIKYFNSLSDRNDFKEYFNKPENQKQLVLDITSDCINDDPKIIFAELNENKQIEIAPKPNIISKYGEDRAGIIAQKRAENYIKEVTNLIKEVLDDLEQKSIEKEQTKTSSPEKQEMQNKKVRNHKDNLKKLKNPDNIIYEEILREILEFARDSEEFTTSDLLPNLENEFGDRFSKGTLNSYALRTLRYCQKKDWICQLDKRKSGAYLFKGKNVKKGLIELNE